MQVLLQKCMIASSLDFFSSLFLSTIFSTEWLFPKHRSELVTSLLKPCGGFLLPLEYNLRSFTWSTSPAWSGTSYPWTHLFLGFPLVRSDLAAPHQAQAHLKNFCNWRSPCLECLPQNLICSSYVTPWESPFLPTFSKIILHHHFLSSYLTLISYSTEPLPDIYLHMCIYIYIYIYICICIYLIYLLTCCLSLPLEYKFHEAGTLSVLLTALSLIPRATPGPILQNRIWNK